MDAGSSALGRPAHSQVDAAEPLVWPADAVIAQVAGLDPDTRRHLDADSGDCVISRPGSRRGSVVVDAPAAEFLRQFSEPRLLIEAVIRYSQATGSDPERVLDDSVPLVARLLSLRLLVRAAAAEPLRTEPTLPPGTRVAAVRIERCVHLFEDVEVYRASDRQGTPLALKIARPGASRRSKAMLDREILVLRRLAGAGAPVLIDSGVHQGWPYLLESWISGQDLKSAAVAARDAALGSYSADLVALCEAVLDAYARLHHAGVVHGDVHPGNIIVGDQGTITILDYGLAKTGDTGSSGTRLPRGAVPFYLDPQHCQALLDGSPPPPADELAEQFALAALCFFLLTGAHYLDFRLARREWLGQVAQARPRSFAACGARPWPEMEMVLRRALQVDPARRYSCVTEFTQHFATAAATRTTAQQPTAPRDAGTALINRLWLRYGPESDLTLGEALPGPRCSVTFGASGLAYYFYRIACLRDDPRALAAADLWARWSVRHADRPDAFYDAAINITSAIVGPISLFYALPGAYCVQALICLAMGDLAGARRGVDGYVRAADVPCAEPDLTLGQAGILLGCALLTEAIGARPGLPAGALHELGDRIAASLGPALARAVTASSPPRAQWLGVAHGVAGILYALLRWAPYASARSAPAAPAASDDVGDYLDWLRTLGRPADDGICWPQSSGGRSQDGRVLTGWCHGSAGYVLLWLEADHWLPAGGFDALAAAAGRHLWGAASRQADPGTLCCGSAGQAYALAALYRRTGDSIWRQRSVQLADRAVATVGHARQRPGSLYKGDVGIALLAEELRHPEHAVMPLFAREGWPGAD